MTALRPPPPSARRPPTAWRALRRGLGGAVGFTLVQQAAYFVSAAWLVQAFGPAVFGAYGQALALAGLLASAGTARLELAGQLSADDVQSRALVRVASRLVLRVGLLASLLALLAWAVGDAPGWLLAGCLALAPLGFVQIGASLAVREGRTVRAAAWRAVPPLAMLVLQFAAAAVESAALALASLPLGAMVGALLVGRAAWPRLQGPVAMSALLQRQRGFVRTELPAFLLNAGSLQGQVLLVGAMAGDAAAGLFALAQRIAFAPTSLFGPALTDWLRARTIQVPPGPALRARLRRALIAMVLLSLVVHGGLALALPALAGLAFPAQGPLLAPLAAWLMGVGAMRLVTSPLTFALPMRGWHRRNLAGQVALFAVATVATAVGLGVGGLPLVAVLYVAGSLLVYATYLVWSWQAFNRAPAPA